VDVWWGVREYNKNRGPGVKGGDRDRSRSTSPKLGVGRQGLLTANKVGGGVPRFFCSQCCENETDEFHEAGGGVVRPWLRTHHRGGGEPGALRFCRG